VGTLLALPRSTSASRLRLDDMKQPRFILTDIGLILETPMPLSSMQREAARRYAMTTYTKRVLQVPAGQRRENLYRVITALKNNDFLERAVPAHDCDREALIYGQ
jgi:hypothetical protein